MSKKSLRYNSEWIEVEEYEEKDDRGTQRG